ARLQPAADASPTGEPDAEWYLVYRDELGESHSVKGATDGIRRAFKDGLLGDASNIVAGRQKQGPFLPFRTFAEFRDMVIAPEPLPTPDLNPRSTPLPPAGPSGRWPDPARSTPARASSTPAGGSATPLRSGSGRFPMPSPTTVSSATHKQLTPTRLARPKSEASGRLPSSGRLPHVPIATTKRRRFELLLWVMVLAIAISTSLSAFYFLYPAK